MRSQVRRSHRRLHASGHKQTCMGEERSQKSSRGQHFTDKGKVLSAVRRVRSTMRLVDGVLRCTLRSHSPHIDSLCRGSNAFSLVDHGRLTNMYRDTTREHDLSPTLQISQYPVIRSHPHSSDQKRLSPGLSTSAQSQLSGCRGHPVKIPSCSPPEPPAPAGEACLRVEPIVSQAHWRCTTQRLRGATLCADQF